jgi:RecA/RadA recombinase
MAKNFMAALQKLEGAVTGKIDPHSYVIRTPSPSVNFIFGNGHGLPRGFTQVLFGPPKGGKTVISNAAIGQLHQDDPEAYAVKFDTELRELGQMSDEQAELWKIDRNRYLAYSVNSPDLIFDRIEKEIAGLCQDGMPLRLIVIDSITGIQGRRAMNADTIMTQQIGDLALTLQDGFKRILPIQRKYGISVILTAHVRAEMDMQEQMRGNKFKMAAAFGVQHYAEYFTFVEPLKTKDGRADALGNKFEDDNVTDMNDNAEKTGHKIRVTMKDSSMGPKGRAGIMTLDYRRGIINTHEEVFTLGVNRGVLEKVNNVTYAFGDKKWTGGRPAMLEAIRADKDLYDAILKELRVRDNAGRFDHHDEAAQTKALLTAGL